MSCEIHPIGRGGGFVLVFEDFYFLHCVALSENLVEKEETVAGYSRPALAGAAAARPIFQYAVTIGSLYSFSSGEEQ